MTPRLTVLASGFHSRMTTGAAAAHALAPALALAVGSCTHRHPRSDKHTQKHKTHRDACATHTTTHAKLISTPLNRP